MGDKFIDKITDTETNMSLCPDCMQKRLNLLQKMKQEKQDK